MKKITVLILFISFFGYSQIGVGTTNPDATLDIIATNPTGVSTNVDGILIPRVDRQRAQSMTGTVTSTMIYVNSIATGTAVGTAINITSIGFYFFDGSVWQQIATSGAANWTLNGNAGTVAANYVGTSDAVDFKLATNGTERARILTGTGQVVINNTGTPPASDMFSAYGNLNDDAVNGYASGNGVGVYGTTSGTAGNGADGINNAAAGTSIGNGVLGITSQSNGMGLVGNNRHSNGTGVFGAGNNIAGSFLIGGSGGAFSSTNVGMYGYGDITAGSYGVLGNSLNASGTGVRGENIAAAGAGVGFGGYFTNNQTGGSGIAGSLGTSSYFSGSAVSGITVSTLTGGTGIIGSCDNATGRGVQGQSTAGTGVLGINNGNITGAGVFAGHTAGGSGTGFTVATARGAIKAQGALTGNYAFGVIGSGGTSTRSGGVLGDNYNLSRGALGYYSNSSVNYGVYAFGNYVLGGINGRTANPNLSPNSMIGIGIYGGVLGGWVKGLVYGANFSGVRYGAYVHGKTLTNDLIAVLNDNGTSERIPTYASTSMKVEVSDRGTDKLANGRTTVSFSRKLSPLLSSEEPITVTVTPLGNSQGLYIENVTTEGFTVVENNNGTSSVKFNWIAIGVKKGYENPTISPEILNASFEEKMNGDSGVMYNDTNPETPTYSLWWDGNQVRFDKPDLQIERKEQFTPFAEIKTLDTDKSKKEIAVKKQEEIKAK